MVSSWALLPRRPLEAQLRIRAVLGVPPDRLDNQVEFVRTIDLSRHAVLVV
jgi:hypothetical protein